MAGIPRFGHTSEFSFLFSQNSDGTINQNQQDGYIVGLVFVGCFLLVFFLVWSIVLLIFKFCIGGFLSGDPFTNPHLSEPKTHKEIYRDNDEDSESEDKKWLRRPRRVRIVFLIAGILQIVFALLMVTHGVADVEEATNSIDHSSQLTRLRLDESVSITGSLIQIGDTAMNLRDQIVFDLDKQNFCPDNPQFNQTQAGKQITNTADEAVQMLNQMDGFVKNNVVGLKKSLTEGNKNLDSVDNAIQMLQSKNWLGTHARNDCSSYVICKKLRTYLHFVERAAIGGLAFPYLVLTSLMMVGTIAAQAHVMTDCFVGFLSWGVLPLFIFVTVVSYVACSLISIFASMNADFCGGDSKTPDQVVMDILYRSGFSEDDLFYKTVRYYAFQCTEQAQEDPFLFLRQYDAQIVSMECPKGVTCSPFFIQRLTCMHVLFVKVRGREIMQNLTQSMTDVSLEQLSLGCNRDFKPLHRSLSQMVGVMDALIQASNRALKVLDCKYIVPIYTDIVYDGTCNHLIKGLVWIFSSFLVVSIMGMIIIMFRSSFRNTVMEEPLDEMRESSTYYHTRTTTEVPSRKRTNSAEELMKKEKWDDEDVNNEQINGESEEFAGDDENTPSHAP